MKHVSAHAILLALALASSAPALAQGLAPCAAKRQFDAMPLPAGTPVALVAGHEFRKADVCVPVEVRAEWQNSYRAFDHEFYDMKASELYPGELWYRTDREEFVIVADGKTYSGHDRVLSFSASGESCNHSRDKACDRWTAYGVGSAVLVDQVGSKTGAFVYGYPGVLIEDEEAPKAVDIMPPHFEFRRSGKDYFRPPMVSIDNLALFAAAPLTYRDITTAVLRRQRVSRTIAWDGNESTDGPTHHRGRATLDISFSPGCPRPFRIVSPEANARLVFSEDSPGTVTIEAQAGDFVDMPAELIEQITWSAPEKPGSEITYDPPSRRGPTMSITYTGLPESNDDFGSTTITASVEAGGSCGALSASATVLLFFPRDATNNPTNDEPNYYFYWLQTRAGHGAVRDRDVRYVHRDFECGENPRWLGYHPRETILSVPSDPTSQPLLVGANYIYVCDHHKYDNIYAAHPSTNFYMQGMIDESLSWEGIDTFAVNVLHELTHRNHWEDWWNSSGGYPKGGYYDENNNKRRDPTEPMIDADEDFIIDARESSLGYDVGERYTFGPVGKGLGIDMYDEHHLTYSLAEKWARGSADHQDWAAPGKQWR